jgi:hypothetical protein
MKNLGKDPRLADVSLVDREAQARRAGRAAPTAIQIAFPRAVYLRILSPARRSRRAAPQTATHRTRICEGFHGMVRRAEDLALNLPSPSRGTAPSRIHRDRGPTVRSGFLSAESGANSVQVLPVSLLPLAGSVLGCRRCLAETPAERLRFSEGRDSETGSGARSMWRSSERSRSGWDGEFESPFLQQGVRNELRLLGQPRSWPHTQPRAPGRFQLSNVRSFTLKGDL